jgi:hypothetical protein
VFGEVTKGRAPLPEDIGKLGELLLRALLTARVSPDSHDTAVPSLGCQNRFCRFPPDPARPGRHTERLEYSTRPPNFPPASDPHSLEKCSLRRGKPRGRDSGVGDIL